MKMSVLLINLAAVSALTAGCGAAAAAPNSRTSAGALPASAVLPAEPGLAAPSGCTMSADGVEHWTMRGAVLPPCIQLAIAEVEAESARTCQMGADAAEDWTARGASLPTCIRDAERP